MSGDIETAQGRTGTTGTLREAAEVVQAEVAFPGRPDPASAASTLCWAPHGAGWRAEVSAQLEVRVRPYGGSWCWFLLEGGVAEISGLAMTLDGAKADAARQAAQFPTLIAGAQWHE